MQTATTVLDLDRLEAAAAHDTPSDDGARWVSVQALAHLLQSSGDVDPRTGRFTWVPLTDALSRLRATLEEGRRPLPYDVIQHLLSFAVPPLESLLRQPRSRLVRGHEVVPLHRLQEVDAKSLQWIGRLPGRNVREKLGVRHRALAVQRQFSTDTPENRLARRVLHDLAAHAQRRLDVSAAYDAVAGSDESTTVGGPALNLAALQHLVVMEHVDVRRSALADVPADAAVQPNNALLGDRTYGKVLLLRQRLARLDEDLLAVWNAIDSALPEVIFLAVAAELAVRGGMPVETLCRATPTRLIPLGEVGGGLTKLLVFGPPADPSGATQGNRYGTLSLSLSDSTLYIRRVDGTRRGRDRRNELSFAISFSDEKPAEARRGRPVLVAESGSGSIKLSRHEYADVEGLCTLSNYVADRAMDSFGLESAAASGRREVAHTVRSVGIDAASETFTVSAGGAVWTTQVATHAWRWRSGDGGGAVWVFGRRDRVPSSTDREVALTSLPGSVADPMGNEVALATQSAVTAVGAEIGLQRDTPLGVVVPDLASESGRRALRTACGAVAAFVTPVWRSVAAAVAWQSSGDTPVSGDVLLVLDAEGAALSQTVLVATSDSTLAKARPASGGIVWERRPPLAADELAEALGLRGLLWRHTSGILKRQSPGLLDHHSTMAAYLVASGAAHRLLFGAADVLLPWGSSGVHLKPDEGLAGDDLDEWCSRLKTSADVWGKGGPLAHLLKTLGQNGQGGRLTVLTLGAAFGHRRISKYVGVHLGRLLLASGAWKELATNHLVESSEAAAHGAAELSLRRREGLPTWKEWVPDLAVEVVVEGRFGRAPLEAKRSTDPFLGEPLCYAVQQPLVLLPGRSQYVLSVIEGVDDGQPLEQAIRVTSDAFPLSEPLRISLELQRRFGLEEVADVVVRPIGDASGPALHGRWTDAMVPPEADRWVEPPRAPASEALAAEVDNEEVRGAVIGFEKGFLKRCRVLVGFEGADKDEERTLRGALNFFCSRLDEWDASTIEQAAELLSDESHSWIQALARGESPADEPNAPPTPGQRNALRSLTSKAVRRLAQPDFEARVRTLLSSMLDGGKHSGAHELPPADAAHQLALQAHRLSSEAVAAIYQVAIRDLLFYRDTSLYNQVVGALANVGLRNPEALQGLARAEAALGEDLVRLAEYALMRLAQNVPLHFASESSENVERMFVSPFENACGLLLAALHLRGVQADPLPRQAYRTRRIVTLIRRLDGLFAEAGWSVRWRWGDAPERPPSVMNVSPLAYATAGYLTGGDPVVDVIISPSPTS